MESTDGTRSDDPPKKSLSLTPGQTVWQGPRGSITLSVPSPNPKGGRPRAEVQGQTGSLRHEGLERAVVGEHVAEDPLPGVLNHPVALPLEVAWDLPRELARKTLLGGGEQEGSDVLKCPPTPQALPPHWWKQTFCDCWTARGGAASVDRVSIMLFFLSTGGVKVPSCLPIQMKPRQRGPCKPKKNVYHKSDI